MKKIICIILVLMLVCASALAETAASATDVLKVSSRTLEDLLNKHRGTWVSGNFPEGSGFFIKVLDEEMMLEDLEAYQVIKNVWETELLKLTEMLADGSEVDEFFIPLMDPEGEIVTLEELLAKLIGNVEEEFQWTGKFVYEFWPIIAGGYQIEYGEVTTDILFPTPYEKDQKVLVLIGIVDVHDDYAEEETEESAEEPQIVEANTEDNFYEQALQAYSEMYSKWYDQDVDWVAFEGIGVERYVEGFEEPIVCIQVTFTPEMVQIIQNEDTLVAVISDEMDIPEEVGITSGVVTH